MADKLLPADLSGTISPEANHPDDLAMYAEINKAGQLILPPTITQQGYPVGGDELFFVEPLSRWRDELANFTVPFTDESGANFWNPVTVQRSIFIDACEKAAEWFANVDRTMPLPIAWYDDDIDVHLHPRARDPFGRYAPQVAFIFRKMTASGKLECGVPYILSPEQVGHLKATNRWPKGKPRSVN